MSNGLLDIISSVIGDVVMPTIDDFTSEVVLTTGTPAYDPVTRSVAAPVQQPAVKAALVRYSFKERMDAAGKISTEDRKALIPSSQLAEKPSGATRAYADGAWYDVKGVDGVPGNVVWILHLRKA